MDIGVEEENQGRLWGRGVHPGPGRGSLRSRRWGAGVSIRARLQPLPREGREQRDGAWLCPAMLHLGCSLSPAVGWAAKGSGFPIRYPTGESAPHSLSLPHTPDSPQSCWSHLCSPAPPHLAQPPSPLPYIRSLPGWPPCCYLALSDLLHPAGTHSLSKYSLRA